MIKCLFPTDAYVVWRPNWLKNLGRTLTYREARTINVNVGSFFSRFYWCANAPATTSCFKNVEMFKCSHVKTIKFRNIFKMSYRKSLASLAFRISGFSITFQLCRRQIGRIIFSDFHFLLFFPIIPSKAKTQITVAIDPIWVDFP